MSDEDEVDQDQTELPIEEPPKFDAGDPEQVGKRRTKLKIAERESERFWQAVFESKVGRREMYKLLRDCRAFETRFACGPNGFPQPEATWFQAGESAWGHRISDSWMVIHTEQYALMLRENDPRFQKDGK